jgi:hypothetical protein
VLSPAQAGPSTSDGPCPGTSRRRAWRPLERDPRPEERPRWPALCRRPIPRRRFRLKTPRSLRMNTVATIGRSKPGAPAAGPAPRARPRAAPGSTPGPAPA